ncbi:hypothetical protein ABW20_dc0100869 [Dactylellina cionopaga]|nr:hypothetical protein ABW20_dc0100869 [Dactylellina cionopaga]
MSRVHPAPHSDTMKELIIMQAIINAYNLPPKFELAAKALGISVEAASGRYRRLKKKIETANALHPLYDVGSDGQPIKRGRGRPPKRPKIITSIPSPAQNIGEDEDDEEEFEETTQLTKMSRPPGHVDGNNKIKLEPDGHEQESLSDCEAEVVKKGEEDCFE